jgi:hypothetical protein
VVELDDAPGGGQTHANTGKLTPGVQLLEEAEQVIRLVRVKAHAAVFDVLNIFALFNTAPPAARIWQGRLRDQELGQAA